MFRSVLRGDLMGKIRKYLSAFLSLFLLLILFAEPVSVCAESEEINDEKYSELVSTGFESDSFDGWTSFGNRSKISITTEKSHSGNAAIITSNREEAWSGPSLNITELAAPGSELLFRAYVISEAPEGANIMLSLKYTDVSGNESYETIAKRTVSCDKWELIENTAVIPSDVENVCAYFETESGLTDFCVDDISIFGYQQATKPPNENTASSTAYDFEHGLNGWIPRGEMELNLSEDFSYSGERSLYVTNKTVFWNAPMVRLSMIKPMVNYTYSAYVMYMDNDSRDTQTFFIKLQYNLNGEEIYATIASKALQKGTWSKISGDFILPTDATDAYFYVQTDNEGDTKFMSYYVDNVSIVDSSAEVKSRKVNTIIKCAVSIAILVGLFFIVRIMIKRSIATKAAIRASCIDIMTNTFNRNTYEERIDELEKSPEKCRDIYVTACDVNFLKYINDNYGHESGDKAIIRCASVLLRAIGKRGKVYRIGGDEFMCISDADFTDAINVEFARENIDYKGYPFSVAVGTSCYDPLTDPEEPDIKAIIARSDKAMYKHKTEIKKSVDFID